MIRPNSVLATLLILLALGAEPLSAQEAASRSRVAGRPGTVARSAVGTAVRKPTRAPGTNSARPQAAQRSRVVPASGEMVMEGEVIQGQPIEEPFVDGEYIVDGGGGGMATCDGNCSGGCASCGQADYCSTCNTPRRFCICLPSHGWAHAEYLLWWQSGMNLPPLVTTSSAGTARAAAGVLPGAGVLYGGDNSALDGSLSGGRIRFGTWFDRIPGLGIEGEYFGLGQQTESFFQQSSGSPILARPFFNITTGAQDADLIAFPSVIGGSVGVDVDSQFMGAAARFRRSLCASSGSAYSPFCCTMVPTASRIDATAGYRFYELKEALTIHEQTQSLDTNNPGSFNITDRFETRNLFNGGEVGFMWQGRRGLWSLDSLVRVGIGNTRQTVTIRGDTTTVENGVSTSYNSGILAQRTNIGTYEQDAFTMIPEVGLTLGYQITRRMRLTAGYNLIYWGNVVRPGDQVDLDVNPNLFPPESNPLTGALRPQFQFASSDYWVHGMSFGAEMRW